jgi:hypothetical protein
MVRKGKKQAQPGTDFINVKPNPRPKQAWMDKLTPVPPLKLTCEIVLSLTVLAQIAEHIEALFLKKMMQNLDD